MRGLVKAGLTIKCTQPFEEVACETNSLRRRQTTQGRGEGHTVQPRGHEGMQAHFLHRRTQLHHSWPDIITVGHSCWQADTI